MKNFVKNESISKSNFVHIYSGITKDELDKKIDEQMVLSGYKPVKGEPGNASYEKGNKVLRILLGAFSKYFKFDILTTVNSDEIKFELKKVTSGAAGGIVGVSQVNKELKRLAAQFQEL